MYDIIMTERFDFHKARLGNGRVCLLQGKFFTVWIRLGVMFIKVDFFWPPALLTNSREGENSASWKVKAAFKSSVVKRLKSERAAEWNRGDNNC